jgi:hypothetical protein
MMPAVGAYQAEAGSPELSPATPWAQRPVRPADADEILNAAVFGGESPLELLLGSRVVFGIGHAMKSSIFRQVTSR